MDEIENYVQAYWIMREERNEWMRRALTAEKELRLNRRWWWRFKKFLRMHHEETGFGAPDNPPSTLEEYQLWYNNIQRIISPRLRKLNKRKS